jgi:23S rRNA (uracil1939-C5)-methyltransferase
MTRPTTSSKPRRDPKPHRGAKPRHGLRTGEHLRLHVTELDEAGLGVGRVGELDVAVPDVLPGEQAEIVVEHLSPHRARAWGRVLQRVGPPAPERVPPSCPAFGRCGG